MRELFLSALKVSSVDRMSLATNNTDLGVYTIILLLEPTKNYTTSILNTNTSDTIRSTQSHAPCGRSACTVLWTYCRSLSCSGTHSNLEVSHVSQYMGRSSIPKCGMCCIQNLKKPTKHCASFIVVGVLRCYNLSYTLERMSQPAILAGEGKDKAIS